MRRRRPWLAGTLSLFLVGLGDVYNGSAGKGIGLALVYVVAGVAGMIVLRAVHGSVAVMLTVVGVNVAIALFGVVRAFRDARRLGAAELPRRSRAIMAAFAVVMLALTLVQPRVLRGWRVPSESMAPTLQLGDHVMTDQWVFGATVSSPFDNEPIYRFAPRREPAVGDIVVFIYPKERDKQFVKRVVATAGQTVEVHGATLRVDGAVRDEPYARYVGGGSNDFGPYTVPAHHVFVLGDNRNQSYDSRFWGPVPIADVLGRVEWIYWSSGPDFDVHWDRIGRPID